MISDIGEEYVNVVDPAASSENFEIGEVINNENQIEIGEVNKEDENEIGEANDNEDRNEIVSELMENTNEENDGESEDAAMSSEEDEIVQEV